jgi:hypothetical protein
MITDPDIFDALFKSSDFVEDTERYAVYNSVLHKISHLVSSRTRILRNWYFQIFLPENHEVKIQYSEIVESELQRNDRRMARCI